MKSKEEIISENGIHLYDEAYQYAGDTEDFRRAMDQYSEQIAIGFAEWIRENEYHPRDKSDMPNWIQSGSKVGWLQLGHSIVHTTTQLYNLYKQTLK